MCELLVQVDEKWENVLKSAYKVLTNYFTTTLLKVRNWQGVLQEAH